MKYCDDFWSIALGNVPGVNEFFVENFMKDGRLLGENVKEFTAIFGKRQKWNEYSCWRIEFEGSWFWILTAKGHGTSWRDWPEELTERCLRFVKMVHEKLASL